MRSTVTLLLVSGLILLMAAAGCAPTQQPAPQAPAQAARPVAPTAQPQAPAAKPAATAPSAAQAEKPAAKAGPTPRRGGTLVYASSADIITLDPPYVSESPSGALINMIYDYLVRYTADLEFKPDLATSWKSEGSTWTFNLRRGVKFHDGTAFNAEAVKSHFERLLGPEKPLRANYWVPFVDKVEVVDDYTVRFHTKFPDAFFLTRLAGNTGAIESPAAFAKYGKDIAKNPVGTGPFKFVEWVKDDRVVVVRNDDYWGDKAYLDKVIVRPIAEASARAIALESGDVQLAIRIPPEQTSRLERNPSIKLESKAVLRNLFIGLHFMKKPFNDLRVRQALNYAINKETIVKDLYQGMAVITNGAVSEGAAGFSGPPGFPYDPAKAKQLLAEAGYPNGFSTTMVGPRGRYLKDFELQQAVQQQLKAVGIDVKLETVEWARYLELLRTDPAKNPMEMWQDSWSQEEAASAIKNRYGCEQFRPQGGNTHGYCNKEVDALVIEAERTVDQTKRDGLLKRAQELITQDAPSIWILTTKETVGMSRKLHDPVHMRTEVLTVDEHTWLEP